MSVPVPMSDEDDDNPENNGLENDSGSSDAGSAQEEGSAPEEGEGDDSEAFSDNESQVVRAPLPPIILAAITGDLETLADLIENQNVDIETTDPYDSDDDYEEEVIGGTALVYSLHNKHDALVTYLVEQKADVETSCTIQNISYITPYLIAVKNNNLAMAKLLLSNGAVSNKIASREDNKSIQDVDAFGLVQSGSAMETLVEACDKLINLVQKGRNKPDDKLSLYREMKVLVDRGASVHQKFDDSQVMDGSSNRLSLMHVAVDFKNTDAIQVLRHHFGADPNLRDNLDQTPLMVAAKRGEIALIRSLISVGATFYIHTDSGSFASTDINKKTCLMLAMKEMDTVKFLMSSGMIQVDDVNEDGMTALMAGARSGNIPFVRYLLEQSPQKPSLSRLDNENQSVLMYTMFNNNPRNNNQRVMLLKYFLSLGANIEVGNIQNQTVLDIAQQIQCKESIELLTANVKLLELSRSGSSTESIKDLLDAGANLSVSGIEHQYSGLRPLHLACLYGHSAVVHDLLQAGADLKSLDDYGQDAVFYAFATQNYDCAAVCLLFPLKKALDNRGNNVSNDSKDKKEDSELAIFGKRTIQYALDYAHLIADLKNRSDFLFYLGSYLYHHLQLTELAEMTLEMFLAITPNTNTVDKHTETEHILAEMSLNENNHPESLDAEMETETDRDDKVKKAFLHVVRGRMKPGPTPYAQFDNNILNSFYRLKYMEKAPVDLSPEGVVQLASEHRDLRRKTIQLQEALAVERMERARLEAIVSKVSSKEQTAGGGMLRFGAQTSSEPSGLSNSSSTLANFSSTLSNSSSTSSNHRQV